MIKYFCDKCHEEIKGDIYRINIYAESRKKPLEDMLNGTSCSTSEVNIIAEYPLEQPMFCEKCKDKIELFMYTGGCFLGNGY